MGRKFTIFALFYFVFEGKFQVQAPRGAYIRRGDLTEGFLRYDFGGLIFGGAYFRNFTVCLCGIYNISRWRWVGGNKEKACYGKEKAVEVEILVEWSRSQAKLRILRACVLIATYGCETWINAFEMKCCRKILKISWTKHGTNKSVGEELKVDDQWLEIFIKEQKLKYFDYLKKMWELGKTHLGGKDRWEKRKRKTEKAVG